MSAKPASRTSLILVLGEMKRFLTDCCEVTGVSDFLDRHVREVEPDGARCFCLNLDAFNDALRFLAKRIWRLRYERCGNTVVEPCDFRVSERQSPRLAMSGRSHCVRCPMFPSLDENGGIACSSRMLT